MASRLDFAFQRREKLSFCKEKGNRREQNMPLKF